MKKLTSVLLCLAMLLALAVPGFAAETVHAEATAVVDAASATVTVVLKAKQPTANAKLSITFDPRFVTYKSMESDMAVFSAKAEDDSVTIGLANATADALKTGDTLASVTFAMTGLWDKTDLTVALESHNGTVVEETMTLTAEGPGYRFEDVQVGQWFYEAVDSLAAEGIIQGISATHFGPALEMNRASFVTMLGRMDGNEDTQVRTRFTDVPVNCFYSGHVAWADENGIVKGVSDKLFAPTAALSRYQMVLFLYRYAQHLGMDVTTEDPSVLAAFPDSMELQGETMRAFIWAVENDIINGIDGKLEPLANTNRAQVAVMLYRFFRNA